MEFTFNTSKLGVRVRPNDRKIGLWVATVTEEAPQYVQENVDAGSQIISVNGADLTNMPFQEAVEHFAQLNLPVTVRFRAPPYPVSKNGGNNNRGGHGHGHHHGHDHHHHHHHHDDDDDESDGTCFIACYIILFVLAFMFFVSVTLNGFPSIPRSLPSFTMFRRNKGSYRRNGPKYLNKENNKMNMNMNSNNENNKKSNQGAAPKLAKTIKTEKQRKPATRRRRRRLLFEQFVENDNNENEIKDVNQILDEIGNENKRDWQI